MAGTATPIYPQTVKNYVAQILPGSTTSLVTLVTGATNGTKIESINVASTDTSARDVQVWLTVSAVNYLLTTVNIPINAGNTNAVVAVDLLRNAQWPSLAYDNNGNKYIYIASGSTLSVAALTTVTTAKSINFLAQGGDF